MYVSAASRAALADSSLYQRSSQPMYVSAASRAALADSSLYQRSSQPIYVPAADANAVTLATSSPLVRREPGMAPGR